MGWETKNFFIENEEIWKYRNTLAFLRSFHLRKHKKFSLHHRLKKWQISLYPNIEILGGKKRNFFIEPKEKKFFNLQIFSFNSQFSRWMIEIWFCFFFFYRRSPIVHAIGLWAQSRYPTRNNRLLLNIQANGLWAQSANPFILYESARFSKFAVSSIGAEISSEDEKLFKKIHKILQKLHWNEKNLLFQNKLHFFAKASFWL